MDMMEIRRRVLLESRRKKRLPDEYQEVEYIESTGTQYIDTGILGNTGIKIECKMGWVNTKPNNEQLWGVRSTGGNTRFYITSYSGIDFALEGDFTINVNPEPRKIYNLLYDTSGDDSTGTEFSFKYGFDDTIQSVRKRSFKTNANIYLFGTNRPYTSDKFLYPVIYVSMIITDSSEKEIFNGIPCYRKSDDEIGLYDTVSKSFFTNSGTGTFLKGVDV